MSDLPARVAVLEQIAKETSATLKEMRDDLKGLRGEIAAEARSTRGEIGTLTVRVASLEGKVSNLPTTWAMLTTMLTIMLGLAGAAFTIAKFVHP